MKRILLPLMAALLLAPATMKAAPVAVPTSVTVATVTPVDDLIKLLNPLLKLLLAVDDGDITDAQIAQYNALVKKINNLNATNGSYKLTSADREALLRWARANSEELTGEKMTPEDLAEARQELNDYITLSDVINDLELETF